MANQVCEVLVTEKPLDRSSDECDAESGAVVGFLGVVRRLENGRKIEGIEYEAHQAMAQHQMQVIADAAANKFGLKRVVLHHRIGFVRAGESSLLLQVKAPHRAAAFDAGKWIVDELKMKVPIWKRPKLNSAQSQSCNHAPVTRRPKRNTKSAAHRAATTT